jgi:hypothetical protein
MPEDEIHSLFTQPLDILVDRVQPFPQPILPP